jgi:hypothetical protein
MSGIGRLLKGWDCRPRIEPAKGGAADMAMRKCQRRPGQLTVIREAAIVPVVSVPEM